MPPIEMSSAVALAVSVGRCRRRSRGRRASPCDSHRRHRLRRTALPDRSAPPSSSRRTRGAPRRSDRSGGPLQYRPSASFSCCSCSISVQAAASGSDMRRRSRGCPARRRRTAASAPGPCRAACGCRARRRRRSRRTAAPGVPREPRRGCATAPSAVARQRIARARLHQRLEHALVGEAQVEDLAQRVQRRNPPAELRARRDDRVDRALAEPLDRRQPEPDALARLHREVQLALVDVGRQHRDAALAALRRGTPPACRCSAPRSSAAPRRSATDSSPSDTRSGRRGTRRPSSATC